jgi:3-oxoacyl-[acyl-carrier protein] reductase
MDEKDSAERVAVVTGSNRGLGHGIAAALRAQNHRIVSLNRTLSGEPWLGEMRCDLACPDQIDDVTRHLRSTLHGIDVCVLNAAVRRLAPIEALTRADWNASLAVNLSSVFQVIQATLPLVRAARGIYVVIGSHAASRYFEGGVAYSATKAALHAVVETLLLEERPHGVRAVLVSPGAIANRDGDRSEAKMKASSIGEVVTWLVTRTPADIAVGEIELRPAVLEPAGVTGIERLQRV